MTTADVKDGDLSIEEMLAVLSPIVERFKEELALEAEGREIFGDSFPPRRNAMRCAAYGEPDKDLMGGDARASLPILLRERGYHDQGDTEASCWFVLDLPETWGFLLPSEVLQGSLTHRSGYHA